MVGITDEFHGVALFLGYLLETDDPFNENCDPRGVYIGKIHKIDNQLLKSVFQFLFMNAPEKRLQGNGRIGILDISIYGNRIFLDFDRYIFVVERFYFQVQTFLRCPAVNRL